jgi:hypothetical protein
MGGRMVFGAAAQPSGSKLPRHGGSYFFRRCTAKMARRRVHKEGWRDAIPF